ncbi:hypothetical protein SAY86_006512 [Trapa natans]|uniref:Pentatricopeptide repeat-containing protein n=1 Tax=Trapa natans TaxID=22666 RepID=A0AAN7QTC8_TRANT|nr:hypothetical protein SAY86_006512 [Trapa natans]
MEGINFSNDYHCVSYLLKKPALLYNVSQKLLFSSGVSKPVQPLFSLHLNAKSARRIHIFTSTRIGYRRRNALVKEESGGVSVEGGILHKEFEFKPSFDEYLKDMESVRSSRGKKHEHGESMLGSKNSSAKKKETSEGREKSEPREKRKKLVENEIDLEKDESSGIKERFSWHNDITERTFGLDSGETPNILQRIEEDAKKDRPLSNNGYDKLWETSKETEEVFNGKLYLQKVRSTKFQKGVKYRVNDAEYVEERAAFRNYDEANDVAEKQPVSRKEMEQRIQKLADGLNSADIDMPEWMFSKIMRSAKIRFSDHSIMRVIQLLGKLGNWRRVLQVIGWLEMRERFKSHKLRNIYTAALDVLGKERRPVEALNVFSAMQQQFSTYPDLVAYHSIAVTLGQAGYLKELFDVIEIMRSTPKKMFRPNIIIEWDPRLEPDLFVYNAVLNACVKRKQSEGAFWVLEQLNQHGLNPSLATYGLVMEVMFACGKYDLVQEFFLKAQKSGTPNALTYRVLVNSLWKQGKIDEAVLAVEDMEGLGIVGSAALYYDLARCLCTDGRCQEALKQIEKLCKVASKPLVVTYTGLIQACLDSGNIHDSISIFQHMEQYCSPNLVTVNIMLKGYLENNMFEDGKKLLSKMLENGDHIHKRNQRDWIMPDAYSFNTMLDACFAEKRWEELELFYKKMLSHGFCYNAKRHLHMIIEASKVGKGELLETTWDHLARLGRSPEADLVKERFVAMLEKDDILGALNTITSPPTGGLLAYHPSKRAWLRFLEENAQRFQKDKLAHVTREVRVHMTSTSSSTSTELLRPELQNFVESCDEFLRTGW